LSEVVQWNCGSSGKAKVAFPRSRTVFAHFHMTGAAARSLAVFAAPSVAAVGLCLSLAGAEGADCQGGVLMIADDAMCDKLTQSLLFRVENRGINVWNIFAS
jgi:hypothetical protein